MSNSNLNCVKGLIVVVLLLGFGTACFYDKSADDQPISDLEARLPNADCRLDDPPSITEAPTAGNLQLTRVFSELNFSKLVGLHQAPGNNERWYVLEQSGVVKTFKTSDTNTSVFADLTDRVASGGERGLLGMAFHPDYANNAYVFVSYTAGTSPGRSVISRLTASSDASIDTSSELIILAVPQPYGNHNGGNIAFGLDGYLYIGLGDGGDGNDTDKHGQNPATLLGAMLRIDVTNATATQPYAIPSDNPFVNDNQTRPEIFALGLRNPWRWSVDRGTGKIIAGDVGQSAREEIDIIESGGNYGWGCYEGTQFNNNYGDKTNCAAQNQTINPIHEYGRNLGYSVTGGYVYRGKLLPSYVGVYFYADFGSGKIWGITDPYGTPSNVEYFDVNGNPSSFGQANNGELYVIMHGGEIYRLSRIFPAKLADTDCVKPEAR